MSVRRLGVGVGVLGRGSVSDRDGECGVCVKRLGVGVSGIRSWSWSVNGSGTVLHIIHIGHNNDRKSKIHMHATQFNSIL